MYRLLYHIYDKSNKTVGCSKLQIIIITDQEFRLFLHTVEHMIIFFSL